MLWQQANIRRSWVKTDTVIKKWLQTRNQMLVLFNQVSGLLPSDDSKKPADNIQLQAFFQVLIDYSSMAHFQVFEILSHAAEKYASGIDSTDASLYEKILASTQFIVAINDKYSEIDIDSHPDLKKDLSQLGIVLAKRMDWENQLVKKYLDITNKYDRDGLGAKLKGFAKLKEAKQDASKFPLKKP